MTTFNFFQYQCFIHFRTQNTNCDDCGVHLFVPKWGRQQSGFTMLFEAFILTLEREIPISKIAEIVDEQHTRIWIVTLDSKKSMREVMAEKVIKDIM